jgi:hypothetical protein
MKTCDFCWKYIFVEPTSSLTVSHYDTTELIPQMSTGDDPKAVPSNTDPHINCPSNVSQAVPNSPLSSETFERSITQRFTLKGCRRTAPYKVIMTVY